MFAVSVFSDLVVHFQTMCCKTSKTSRALWVGGAPSVCLSLSLPGRSWASVSSCMCFPPPEHITLHYDAVQRVEEVGFTCLGGKTCLPSALMDVSHHMTGRPGLWVGISQDSISQDLSRYTIISRIYSVQVTVRTRMRGISR